MSNEEGGTKKCIYCGKVKRTHPDPKQSDFYKNADAADGFRGDCRVCDTARRRRNDRRIQDELAERRKADLLREADRKSREQDDYRPLGIDNYNITPKASKPKSADLKRDGAYRSNSFGGKDPKANGEKKQEYSKRMGKLKDSLRARHLGDDKALSKTDGHYVSALAEDELRFMNRRQARSISLAVARDELALRRFKMAAKEYLSGTVTPSRYGLKYRPEKGLKRTVNVILSDLHFGSALGPEQNLESFSAIEESRRFAKVVAEVADYKLQYRGQTHLNAIFDGDLVNGFLLKDLRDGDPMTEQYMAFITYARRAIQVWSEVFPSVDVHFAPGNHGRDIARHPGRATNDKWDGHETRMMYAVAAACDRLKNVRFHGTGLTHKLPVHVVDLYGQKMLVFHGDTEPKMQDPDTGAKENAHTINTINTTRQYGYEFAVAVHGHYHKARNQPLRSCRLIANGALIPPNGHARAAGYVNERCGQWIFESVEGYPVGDMRFVEVGRAEDQDASLNKIIAPFEFGLR